MRHEANRMNATMATGVTVAALSLAAGQAWAQSTTPTTGKSGTSASAGGSNGSATTGAAKSAGRKTYSNSGSKKTTPASAKSSTSNANKPLVTGGSSLTDLVAAAGGLTPGADTSAKAAKPAKDGKGEPREGSAEAGVKVSDYMTVDIFVQDEDLANVLQMLSLQSRKNIIASKDVSASVTANLYGVTFYEALDSVLHVNGYGYIEKGNFIYVHTLEEIAAIEAADRKIVSKIIRLNYLNANDAAEFVTPLLSEAGQIKTNGDVGPFTMPKDNPVGDEKYALAAMIIVFDYPDHIAEVEELLNEIDTKPAQVLVEATILQTSLNEANAFGVDFSVLHDVDFLDFLGGAGPLGAPGAIAQTAADGFGPLDNEGSAVASTAGNFGGPATIKAAIMADQVGVFIRALDEVGNVSILSNPKILALNRQPAKVLVGRKLGYLNTTATQTSTTQTVEFLDTGTQLSFRPFVSNDGMVRLELKPRVSEGVIRTATDATGAAVTIPDEITQEITTNVIVPDGSTVVLGGLFKETTKLNRSQVPVLGDIPILGLAFQGHDDSTDRAEIIFMIKPTVVHDKMLAEQGDRAIASAENVRTGSRQGLLPFSRERQTAQLNLEAERLAAEGKTDEAMWKLRRSIELNPVQPDAIRLKEKIQGSRDIWPSGSILERVIDGNGPLSTPSKANGVSLYNQHRGIDLGTKYNPVTGLATASPATAADTQTTAATTPVSTASADASSTTPQSPSLFGSLAQLLRNPEGTSTPASSTTTPPAPAQSSLASTTPSAPASQAIEPAPGITIIPTTGEQPAVVQTYQVASENSTGTIRQGTFSGFALYASLMAWHNAQQASTGVQTATAAAEESDQALPIGEPLNNTEINNGSTGSEFNPSPIEPQQQPTQPQ
jgi:type IV pilus assembly protein PilQ